MLPRLKNCCRVLWKTQRHLLPLQLLLFFMCLPNHAEVQACRAEEPRAQRRFMWKQMDDTVDGIVDGMVTSARAMKSMIGDLLPTAPTTALSIPFPPGLSNGNMLDYMPSETTRVKYIIRSPASKSMKLVKIRPPKKVIKIVSVPKAIIETKSYKSSKPKIHFPNAEELSKMEKEQEMIAEGRLPAKNGAELSATTQSDRHNKESTNEIVSGTIHEFGNGWTPVYDGESTPTKFYNLKSHPVSQSHTDVMGEPLPEPQKQIYQPTEHELNPLPKSSYEVTEHAAEESVALPLTQEYRNSRGFVPLRGANHAHHAMTTNAMTTTTTTEEPNYPAPFLRKQRERNSGSVSQTTVRFRPSDAAGNTSWMPSSNLSYSHVLAKSDAQSSNRPKRVKIVKTSAWSHEMPTLLPFSASTQSIAAPQSTKSTLRTTEPVRTTRKSAKLKTESPKAEYKPNTDVSRRGSVKFGDSLTYGDK